MASVVVAWSIAFAGIAAGQAAPAPAPAPMPAASRAALITQLQSQLQTFESTAKADPARPALALQIVEAYVALRAAALADKANAQARRQQLLATANALANPHANTVTAAVTQQTVLENQARQVAHAAYKKAIEYAALIINDHAGSPFVPRAHLAMGDLYFEEAATDPSKLELAAKAYAEVTKFPPPSNAAYGYASYKLAFVHWNKGETTDARRAFTQAIDFGTKYPRIPGATALANAARADRDALPP